MKKMFSNKNFWPLVIVIFTGLLAGRGLLLQGYFNMHDDLQMMRQLEMEKCFLDFQIPCRWVPDMGYGFGFPLFNYYPPLPYLIGELFRLIGFSFVDTVKAIFLLSFLASSVTMYFLGKEFFGRLGGILASVFYVWAPYHSVDVYVRGAMNEAWALAWFPLILLFSYKLITNNRERITRNVVFLSLSWFALLTSHNLMVLIFTPFFVGWCLLFFLREKSWKRLPHLAISGIFAFGLAAFFTLPAILEQKYVQVNTLVQGYYEYIAHFASLNQLLFSRFWGYGPSVWEERDGMSFQIGHIHWILSLVVGAVTIYKIVRERKKGRIIHYSLFIILFFVSVGWASAFMAHSRSTPIWQAIGPLKFVQFPWRFLTINILAFSLATGSLVLFLRPFGRLRVITTLFLMLVVVVINWNYFKPEKVGPLTDSEKFAGAAWELQQTAGIYDYLPTSAKTAPKAPREEWFEYLENAGEVGGVENGTNWLRFKVNGDGGKVRINIFNFPVWKVFVDEKETTVFTDDDDDELGRIHFTVTPGEHSIYAKLFDTWPRKLGNTLSIVSWAFLFYLTYVQFKRGRNGALRSDSRNSGRNR